MPGPELGGLERGAAEALRAIRNANGEAKHNDSPLFPDINWSVEPTALAGLAERLGRASSAGLPFSGAKPTLWPPRSAYDVFADLASGRGVAAIEVWRLLADRAWWSDLRDGRRVAAGQGEVWGANGVAARLWELSHQWPSLRADLLWKVGKELAGVTEDCEPELVENIRYAAREHQALLGLLKDGDGVGLVIRAEQQGQTPREYLAQRGLPSRVLVAKHASALAVSRFFRDVVSLEDWLIRCLADLPSADRDYAVDELLAQLTDAVAACLPALRDALGKWYAGSGVVKGNLSSDSRARISDWSGLFRWDAFLRFVEGRFGHRLAELPRLQGITSDGMPSEYAARRALGRMVVWRNYATRITVLRLYVPQLSDLQLALDGDDGSSDWVEYRPHVALRLMVMIGPLLVDVPLDDREPIRGARIPDGSDGSFESARAAIGDSPILEFEVGGKGWQSHLYEALKERQVVPNEGLMEFQGVPRRHLNSNGMPLPAPVEAVRRPHMDHTKNGKAKCHSPKKKK